MLVAGFECQLITPLFMAGADQGRAELRAPSIKGAIRWWFRAMMGGVLGDNIPQLHRLESRVFGSTDAGSPISVRIKNVKPDPPRTLPQPRLPHKTENDEKAWRNAIKPGQTFRIELSLANRFSARGEMLLDVAKHSLLLALTLGGFGNRSRRGFGSVYLSGEWPKEEKEIVRNAEKVFTDFILKQKIPCKPWANTPKFPCIANNYFDIWIADGEGKWMNELSSLMQEMSKFSHGRNGKAIGGATPSRQASPLIVHAKPGDGEMVRLVFSHFRCKLSSDFTINDSDRDALVNITEVKLNAKRVEVFS